jgi:hypothetical protein
MEALVKDTPAGLPLFLITELILSEEEETILDDIQNSPVYKTPISQTS